MKKFFLHLQRHAAWTCLVSGALTTLSLAPFHLWIASLVTVAAFAMALHQQSPARLFFLSWLFGVGLFGSGISWIYVSIHDYGYAPIWLATFLTALFVVFLAAVFALPFLVYGKWFAKHPVGLLLALPALWVLGEWSRSWLLTGFPWLYLGYGYLTSPLAGWFPVAGVFSVSFIVAFTGCALAHYCLHDKLNPLIFALTFFVCGYGLHTVHWTQVRYDSPIAVGIVQPNFALEDKWNPAKYPMIRQTLEVMSQPLWQQDVILWPEAALSELYQEAQPFLQPLDAHGKNTHTTLITGIPYYDKEASLREHRDIYYNSVTALGDGSGLYHKVRLVPFGEYVPFENWLRGIIHFFDLPMSEFSKGPEHQELLLAGRWHVAPYICYEIVYPDLVARNAKGADFLVTISNDSWFGHSIGPWQHLQMAQARALETQHFLIRGTNDGVSAIIDNEGLLQQAAQRFSPELLNGTIYPVAGETPFMRWGSMPLIALLCAVLISLYAVEFFRSR